MALVSRRRRLYHLGPGHLRRDVNTRNRQIQHYHVSRCHTVKPERNRSFPVARVDQRWHKRFDSKRHWLLPTRAERMLWSQCEHRVVCAILISLFVTLIDILKRTRRLRSNTAQVHILRGLQSHSEQRQPRAICWEPYNIRAQPEQWSPDHLYSD